MTILDQPISVFKSPSESGTPSGTTTLREFLHAVKAGKFREDVERIRALPTKAEKVLAKKHISVVTPSGTCERRRDGVNRYSGVVVMDFDDVEKPTALRNKLAKVPYVVAAFVSIGGAGVCALVRVDDLTPETVKPIYEAIAENLKTRCGHPPDTSGSDLLSRLRIYSHDPDTFVNESASPFKVPKVQTPLSALARVEAIDFGSMTESIADGIDNPRAIQHLRNIIRKSAQEKELSPSVSRHAFMNSAVVTAYRYHLGGHVVIESAYETIVEEYTALFSVAERGERAGDVRRSMGVGRDGKTIVLEPKALALAKLKGPLSPEGDPFARSKYANDVASVTVEETADLLSKLFLPSDDNRPPDVPTVLTLCRETKLGHVGSLVTIVAEPKAGKSTVCSAIWAAYYGAGRDGDTFGFTVTPPAGQTVAYYFDSEQHPSESWEAWKRTLRRMNCETSDELSPDARSTWVCLMNIEDNLKRQAALFMIIENDPNVGLVIIDGIADFVSDPNEAVETDRFLRRLRALAAMHGVCVIVTIHENKGRRDVNPRGHLGSHLLRVSESIISLSKDRQTGIHTIAVSTARRGSDTTRFTFAYDDVRGTHVSKGAPAEKLAVLTDLHLRFQARVSTRKLISRAEIEAMLCELDAEIASKGAEAKKKDVDRHIRKLVTASVLKKGAQRGWYEVVSAEGDQDDDGLF